MRNEQRPAAKPAPHPLEAMAMRFEIYAWDQDACVRKKWVKGMAKRDAETKAAVWRDAAKECREALAELQGGTDGQV